VILLRVDPASPWSAWEAARDEAQALVDRIAQGEAFEDLARERSDDPSAEEGGDMGYLHEGMLSPNLEEALQVLEIGQVTPPVRLLEGYAVGRLADRTEPSQLDFDSVKVRAEGLLRQELGETAWRDLLETLRSQGQVIYNDEALARLRDELMAASQ
jgi:parvulin-like peptidyl-prolyl isomerase